MRILAVDDDPYILQVLRLVLTAGGYSDVTLAKDAVQAEKMIAEAEVPFDIFLLDIQMPGKSGIELCRAIRSEYGHADAPIIMLTAMSEKRYVDEAFQAGASDYLSKPFETIELQARVRAAERSVQEAAERIQVQRQLASVVTSFSFQPAVDFEDSLDIEDLSNFLSFDRFHNLFRQTLRGGYAGSALYGVKVPIAAQLYGALKARDFLNFIGDVGDAISEVIDPVEDHFTYAGSGYFLVWIGPDAVKVTSDALAEAIQDMIKALGVKRPDGQPKRVGVIVGDRVSPEAFREDQADAAIARAVKEAELAAVRGMTVQVGASDVQAERLALRVS